MLEAGWMGADAGWKVGREKEASHDHKKAPVFTENTQVDVSFNVSIFPSVKWNQWPFSS